MIPTPDNLDYILEAETSKNGQLWRLFHNASLIETTAFSAAVARCPQKVITDEQVILKPDYVLNSVLTILMLCSNLLLLHEIYTEPIKELWPLYILQVVFVFFLIAFIKQFFLSSKTNYLITINSLGISIGGEKYLWFNIEETAIFHRGESRGKSRFLIIKLKDQPQYLKFALIAFDYTGIKRFAVKLSQYIEHFKTLNPST